jgi:hypothetical protein
MRIETHEGRIITVELERPVTTPMVRVELDDRAKRVSLYLNAIEAATLVTAITQTAKGAK